MKGKLFYVFMVVLLFSVLLTGCSRQAQGPTAQGEAVASTTATGGRTAWGDEIPTPPPGFPSGPITVIVPQAAGGGVDAGVRLKMRYAQEFISQPLVVQNMPGGSTIVGITEAMRRPADGHTLIQTASATVLATAIGKQFDVINDFDYVSLQVADPRVISFHPDDRRFSTGAEFLQFARNNPGALTLAVSGLNNSSHISAEYFMHESGLQFQIVTFDGNALARPAFLGRHVDAIWQTVGETKPMLLEGQLVPVAIMAYERYEDDLPGTPTALEFNINVIADSYRGYGYRKGVDMAIVNYMARVFEIVSRNPDYIRDMSNIGLPNTYLGPEEYTRLNREEVESYDVVLRLLGMI